MSKDSDCDGNANLQVLNQRLEAAETDWYISKSIIANAPVLQYWGRRLCCTFYDHHSCLFALCSKMGKSPAEAA